MQAVILAAGEGTRMHPLTLTKPKPLIEVLGKPILTHILEALPEGIDRIVIVVGYKADQIRAHYGQTWNGIPLMYVDQEKPLGTAHALSLAAPHLSGTFLLMNADDIHGRKALAEAVTHPLALLVSRHEDPSRFGVVEVSEDGTLKEIAEKPEQPATNLISTGAMVLDARIFEHDVSPAKNGEYYLPEALGKLAKAHPIRVIEQDVWIPLGYPEDIAPAEDRLRSQRH